jgi:hypothetical protein
MAYACLKVMRRNNVCVVAVLVTSAAYLSLFYANSAPGQPHKNTCPHIELQCLHFIDNAGVQLSNNKLVWNPKYIDKAWRLGNRLSAYWNARATAFYGSQSFQAGKEISDLYNSSWLAYLPRSAPAAKCPHPELYLAGCLGCTNTKAKPVPDHFYYPHICNGAWTGFRDQIRQDTKSAITAWLKGSSGTLVGKAVTDYRKHNSAIIQFRCEKETILVHDEHGPLAYSCYDAIPDTPKTIIIVAEPTQEQICTTLLADLVQHLKIKRPSSTVAVQGGTIEEDFITLWQAPFLIRSSQSSFGLWAGFAGHGEVWSAPLLDRYAFNTTPNLGTSWHWLQCPILYPDVATRANLNISKPDGILEWLRTN